MSYNPNQSNNGGYHPRKNHYRNQQQPQYMYQPPTTGAAYPPEYLNAYQQAYQYYPSPQAQYYSAAAATPGAQFVQVAAQSPYPSPHPLTITDSKGDSVDLRQLNSSTYTPKSNNANLNRSSNPSTPKVPGASVSSSPYAHQRTSSITSTKKPSLGAGDDEAAKLREAFRQQIQARAQRAKETKSSSTASTPAHEAKKPEEKSVSSPAPTPASASTPAPPQAAESVPTTEKVKEDAPKEQTPVKEEPKSESKPEEKPKVDDAEEQRRKFRESIAAKTKKLEEEKKASSKASTPEPTVETPAKEEESKPVVTESVKAEEPATEVPVTSTPEVAKVEESTVEAKKDEEKPAEPVSETKSVSIEEPKPEEKESSTTDEQSVSQPEADASKADAESEDTPKEPVDTFTISRYFERINDATPIDPYKFEYSENLIKLSEEERPSEKSEKKYRYHPGFLMQFADVVKFPIDDEFKEKIKFIQISEKGANRSFSKGGQGGQFRSGFGQGSIGGGPGSGFSKSGSSRGGKFDLNSRSNSRQNSKRKGGSGRNDRKSNRNRDREVEKEPEVPAEPVKPLEKSATRWIPKSRLKKAEDVKYAPDGKTVILDQDDVNRKVKSFLNKLTLEYFEEISNDIINIANQSQWETNAETLKLVLELTFAKACDEPHWSSMYAQFCAKMCKDVSSDVKDEEVKDKSGELVTGGNLVRKLLLTRCQTEYTKGWADKLPSNEDGSALEPDMMTDEYYQAAAAKRRGLGLIRFIGHLYVLGLLSDQIILTCIVDQSKNTVDPSEDAVENLIQLIKTVGPKLDAHESPVYKNRFGQCFQQVHEMIKHAKISSRLEFKLMDLVDLRKRRWEGGESDAGPKTIQQIHQEAELKKQEEEKNSRDRRNQNRNDSRQNSSKAPWGSQRVSSNDIRNMGHVRNSNASSSGPTNNFTRAKSLRGSNRQSSQNLSSENSSNNNNSTTPATASPLGARENSKKGDTPAGNSFNALMNDDGHKDDEAEGEQPEEEEGQEEEPESEEPAIADAENQEEPSIEPTEDVESKEDESAN